jgi:hypothetical protein
MRSISDLSDTLGHWLAILGLFSQGLAGGLALTTFFSTYLLLLRAGTPAFLQYYAAQAQDINRAFFTLISLSMVAAAARMGADSLGQFKPHSLR